MKVMTFKSKVNTVFFLLIFTISWSCTDDDSMDEIVKEEEMVEEQEQEEENEEGNEEDNSEEVNTPVILLADELTGTYTTCNDEGTNEVRETDIANPVNVGKIDDRSCYANYYEVELGGLTWGAYNITHESNHMDTNGLQPRIERSLNRSQSTAVGSYAYFTGTVRILEVGYTSSDGTTGSYIMQAKGKHTGGGGSADPAICLYLAKPVYGTTEETKDQQVSFDLYREQIKVRGGTGASGREIVYLTNIPKGQSTEVELKVGFRQDPNDASKKIHYADAIIGGEEFNWNIPEPERGTQSGIRYGAYRVKGGRAQIRWANTTYNKVEK